MINKILSAPAATPGGKYSGCYYLHRLRYSVSPVWCIFKNILGDEQEEDKEIEEREDGQKSLIEEENKDTNKTKIRMENLVGGDSL